MEFKDRVESQEEIVGLLEKSFDSHEIIDEKTFFNIVENVSSEIFLYTLIFILEKRPFSKTTLDEYTNRKTKTSNTPYLQSKMIMSPSTKSKFASSHTLKMSPTMKKRSIDSVKQSSINTLLKLTGGSTNTDLNENMMHNHEADESVKTEVVHVSRKNRHLLQYLDDTIEQVKNNSNEEDFPTIPAFKQHIKSTIWQNQFFFNIALSMR